MISWVYTTLVITVLISTSSFGQDSRSLVENSDKSNLALLVGVTYGLPGIDLDLNNVDEIARHPAFRFNVSRLWEEQGTVDNVAKSLTETASKVDTGGSMLFYFSGHGDKGGLLMQDRLMKLAEIKAALEKGRQGKGPLSRLVLMFDSCYSGSLVDPLNRVRGVCKSSRSQEAMNIEFVNELMTELGDRAPYWSKLFVFASSRADETSLAGSNGSVFTVAMRKAFDEVAASKGSMKEFIEKTMLYTEGHHPVPRLVPDLWANEALVP